MTIPALRRRIVKLKALESSPNQHEARRAHERRVELEKVLVQMLAQERGGGLLGGLKELADILEDKDGSAAAEADEKSWGDIWGDLSDAFKDKG